MQKIKSILIGWEEISCLCLSFNKGLGDQGHVVRRQDTKQILAYIKFHIRKNLERLGAIYNAQWLIYLREQ